MARTAGALPVVAALCERLGLVEAVDRFCPIRPLADYTHGQVVLALVANRLTHPRPLSSFTDWGERFAVQENARDRPGEAERRPAGADAGRARRPSRRGAQPGRPAGDRAVRDLARRAALGPDRSPLHRRLRRPGRALPAGEEGPHPGADDRPPGEGRALGHGRRGAARDREQLRRQPGRPERGRAGARPARRAAAGLGRAAAGTAGGRRLEAALAGERARLPAARPALLLPPPEGRAAATPPGRARRGRLPAARLPAAAPETRRAALPRPSQLEIAGTKLRALFVLSLDDRDAARGQRERQLARLDDDIGSLNGGVPRYTKTTAELERKAQQKIERRGLSRLVRLSIDEQAGKP